MYIDSVRYLGVCGVLRVPERVNDVREWPKVSGEQVLCGQAQAETNLFAMGLHLKAWGERTPPF